MFALGARPLKRARRRSLLKQVGEVPQVSTAGLLGREE
jgi:hypothetical protein